MKSVVEIINKSGKVSKVLYQDASCDDYIIIEVDENGNELNSIRLNQQEFDKLHISMSQIENY